MIDKSWKDLLDTWRERDIKWAQSHKDGIYDSPMLRYMRKAGLIKNG